MSKSGALDIPANDDGDDVGHECNLCLWEPVNNRGLQSFPFKQHSELFTHSHDQHHHKEHRYRRHCSHPWPASSSSVAAMLKAPLSPVTSIIIGSSSYVKDPPMNSIQNHHHQQPKAPLSLMNSIISRSPWSSLSPYMKYALQALSPFKNWWYRFIIINIIFIV